MFPLPVFCISLLLWSNSINADPQWDQLNQHVIESDQAENYQEATGWAEKALEYALTKILALGREFLGNKDPDTLAIMDILAAMYESQDRYDRAEPLHVETLALSREVQGEKHPRTVANMGNLAITYQYLGRHDLAESLFTEALALNREILGEKHPNTLTSMNNLAL